MLSEKTLLAYIGMKKGTKYETAKMTFECVDFDRISLLNIWPF